MNSLHGLSRPVATKQYKREGGNNWKSLLVNKSGNTDQKLVTLFLEIIYWYKPCPSTHPVSGEKSFSHKFQGNVWQTSYSFLADKLGFSKETIRRKLCSLEELNIIKRSFKSVFVKGQEYNNRMFIHLNDNFFKQVTGFSKISTSDQGIFDPNFVDPSPQISTPHIIDIYNNNYSNRSIKSNFEKSKFKNSFEKKEGEGRIISKLKSWIFGEEKKLKDFYPLSEEEGAELQKLSGREFDLNAMNEILKAMSVKLETHSFRSKKGFMSYMSKALKYEKRQACQVNNEGFKIKANMNEEERKEREEEEYLNKIELSREVSKEWQLKKKIASNLPRSKACEILKAYLGGKIEEGRVFKLRLAGEIEMSEAIRSRILEEVRWVYEKSREEGIERIEKLEIEMESKTGKMPKVGEGEIILPKNEWGKIRERLIEYHGEEGKYIDRNWISRIEAEIDEGKREIRIKGPSRFYEEWIKENYMQALEKQANIGLLSVVWEI